MHSKCIIYVRETTKPFVLLPYYHTYLSQYLFGNEIVPDDYREKTTKDKKLVDKGGRVLKQSNDGIQKSQESSEL